MLINIKELIQTGKISGNWVKYSDDFILDKRLKVELILNTNDEIEKHRRPFLNVNSNYIQGLVKLTYIFHPGFITDFASVPKRLRGFIDNTAPDMRLPAIVHDINYSSHFFDFKTSNAVFKQMIRMCGGSRVRALFAHWAVSTHYAKKCYDKYKIDLAEPKAGHYYKQHVQIYFS